MPVHRCSSSSLCLHELGGFEADEAGDFEYVEIDPSGRYGRYKEVLGRGAFKTVYRAFDQEDGIEVAWNQVQDVLLCTQEDLDRLYSEVHLLSQLKHKNIMKLYHSWVDKKAHTLNFITEIFTSGTLRQYRKRHKHIDIKAVKNWSRQIVRGLLYLHSHDPPIIHRDLKCDNIFINGNHGEVKIGDLGLAAILEHAHARSVIGTPEFMAPELYEEEYTELVDIYSFGMCLLEMVTSQYPYSECSNAAQIYRKVMQGKRPEAMKLVKDRELCQFIEKCLAPASKRLPARELLMDPFLHCEASQSALESSPFVGRMRRAIGMDDADVINDDAHAISATVQISYVMKETLPAFVYDGSESCGCLAGDSNGAQIGELKVPQAVELVPSQLKEDRGRSVDFRVNGKRREDNNVFLKLQISGSEGQVRNIHFPFDVQCDTALCVASEMVAELDLTDQDVTKIAEMIDAAIMALVPEWKPGVAIDETCCEGETLDIEGCDHSVNEFDTVSLSQGLLEDMIPPPMTETLSPTKVEGLIYSRFEEVTYQCHRSEFPAVEVEQCTEICTVTSTASDSTKEADWSLSDTSSHLSQTQVSTHEDVIPVFEQLTHTDSKEFTEVINVGTAFNELVELNRKSGCANFVHKLLEGLAHGHSCCEMDTTLAPALLREKSNECDDAGETELAELVKRHEQEKLELQRQHDEALAEVRRRWQRKTICENRDDGYYPSEGEFLGKSHMSLKTHGSSLELQGNIHCELVSLSGSMTSLEDFSSIGQETPKSMSTFVGSWQEVKL